MENNNPVVSFDAWPNELVVTRNGISLTFKKIVRERESKDGVRLPFYTYSVKELGKEIHEKFWGEELIIADLQAKLNNKLQLILSEHLSGDKSRVDDESLVKDIESYSGRAMGIKKLEEELTILTRDFTSNPPTTLEEMQSRAAKMKEVMEKIDAKRRKNAENADSEEE